MRHEQFAEAIADNFISVLDDWLTDEEWDTLIWRNGRETNPYVCHTHDFCDANMAMTEAFHGGGFATPTDICEDSNASSTEYALQLWNVAWQLAGPRLGRKP